MYIIWPSEGEQFLRMQEIVRRDKRGRDKWISWVTMSFTTRTWVQTVHKKYVPDLVLCEWKQWQHSGQKVRLRHTFVWVKAVAVHEGTKVDLGHTASTHTKVSLRCTFCPLCCHCLCTLMYYQCVHLHTTHTIFYPMYVYFTTLAQP